MWVSQVIYVNLFLVLYFQDTGGWNRSLVLQLYAPTGEISNDDDDCFCILYDILYDELKVIGMRLFVIWS